MYIEHLHIPVGTGSLHAERIGRGGLPVVLLHGFGTCAFLWRAVAPRLAESGFTVISLDLMGHGESDRPVDSNYSLTAQAEYLDRALTVLRVPFATIVGQDVGGLVGMQLAARRPERVERLAVLNPPALEELPGPEIRALQLSSVKGALSSNSLFGVSPILGPLLRDSVAVPAHMPDLLVARYMAPFVGAGGVEHLLMLASAVEFDGGETPSLPTVRAPVLLVRGDQDRWTDPSIVSRMATLLPRSRIASLPGVGRLIAEEAPEGLARLLAEWIREGATENSRAFGDANEAEIEVGGPAPQPSAGAGPMSGLGPSRSTENTAAASS